MTNSNVKKVLEMTSLLFGMALLFSFIAWFLGYDGFVIFGHIEYPTWIDYIVCPILLCINLSFITGFTLNLYSWHILLYSAPMAFISGIFTIFFPYSQYSSLFTGPIPTLILIFVILYKKIGKGGFIRLGIITAATIIFQMISSIINHVGLSPITKAYDAYRLSISSILLMLLIYSLGGAKYVLSKSFQLDFGKHWKYNARRLELLVFPRPIRDDGQSNQNIPPVEVDGVQITGFERWVMWSVIAVVQILQWIFILWVCNLGNYFIDGLVITTSFICHGMIISKRNHLKPIILCTLAATVMFYISAKLTISFQYSQFFPIVIGLILVYTLYRASYYFEKQAKAKLNKDLDRIRALEAKVDEAWDKLNSFYD